MPICRVWDVCKKRGGCRDGPSGVVGPPLGDNEQSEDKGAKLGAAFIARTTRPKVELSESNEDAHGTRNSFRCRR